VPKILFHSGSFYETGSKTGRAWFPTTGFSFFSLIQNPLRCFRIITQCFVVTDLVKPPLKARGALSDVIQIFDVNVKLAAHTHTHTQLYLGILQDVAVKGEG
jgi:hypothetical protein